MSQRFFFPFDPACPPVVDQLVELDSAESHHLIHVMRAQPGQHIELFDGSGYQFAAKIEKIGRRHVTALLTTREKVNRELPNEVTIAIPFPKSERQKFLVEKLTEIGVHALDFLMTERSSVKGNEKTVAKLERLVIEASKQCQRNQLMKLRGPVKLEEWVESINEQGQPGPEEGRFFALPSSTTPILPVPAHQRKQQIVIGPEGGFSEREVEFLIKHGWQGIKLGPTILRMETAAIVVAALVAQNQ